ncbi:MAG: IS66 family transposase [Sandaracinaceae bacterium]|nr:IS66 family transposase [Sandaracinaceae bacterium]
MPLHRLEQMYAREGVEMARSTICGWHEQLRPLVEPLIAAMRAEAFTAYLCTDATGVLVQARTVPPRTLLGAHRPWKTRALRVHAQPHQRRGRLGCWLATKAIVADAHVVYDHLYERGDIVEVNCWAHSRRYFFKAMASDPSARAKRCACRGCCSRSSAASGRARKKRAKPSGKHSAPVVERFFSWCDAEWERALEDTPMYAALRYARNQRVGLQRFLADGRLPLENNISERELRRQAVGRKNWLFVGSDDAAHVNAAFTRSSPAAAWWASSLGSTCATSSACFRPGPLTASSRAGAGVLGRHARTRGRGRHARRGPLPRRDSLSTGRPSG